MFQPAVWKLWRDIPQFTTLVFPQTNRSSHCAIPTVSSAAFSYGKGMLSLAKSRCPPRVEGDGVFKLTVQIRNTTSFTVAASATRETALLHSLVSTHTILGATDGAFVSLLAPPQELSEHAASCKNVGTWPVLVGEEGQRDTMLSSPIILYDYPQIAPESAGDLFDGTEIDEILSLRIMTLTDEEKLEMRQSDERARQMLERTETMPVEHLMKLHGVLRGLRPLKEEAQ